MNRLVKYVDLIHSDIRDRLHCPRGPANFQHARLIIVTKPEGEHRFMGRRVAGAGRQLAHQAFVSLAHDDSRSDAVSIAGGTNELEPQPMARFGIVAKDRGG